MHVPEHDRAARRRVCRYGKRGAARLGDVRGEKLRGGKHIRLVFGVDRVLGDDAPLTKREDGRVGILERHADNIAFAKKKAVRIVADVGCNGKGVPHCRIFAQKVPPDAGVRTLNAALVVMRNFYECAIATRNVLCEKYPKIAKYLNERFAIEKDEKSLEGG